MFATWPRFWIGLIVAVAPIVPVVVGAELPTVDELVAIERRMIESRKSISTGRVTVAVRYNAMTANPTYVNYVKRYTLYFDGSRFRADLDVTGPGKPSSMQHVLTDDVFIRAIGSTGNVLLFGPDNKPKESAELVDPRRLGLVVWCFDSMNSHGYESHFLRPDRRNFKIQRGEENGEKVLKVSFEFDAPTETVFAEYCLAPDSGYLPTFAAVHTGQGGKRYEQSIRTTLKQYPSGVYYPQRVVFRTTAGDQLQIEEVVDVESAAFGGKLDKQTFELAGLALAKGRIVDNDGRFMVWTGQRMIPNSPNALPRQHGGYQRIQSRLLPLGAIALAMMATAALWIRWRRGQ